MVDVHGWDLILVVNVKVVIPLHISCSMWPRPADQTVSSSTDRSHMDDDSLDD